mmetsp:Transcript_56072/g.121258  ORF Transcript_56072/g.121258 Transcript_56072/m.121258 type:complete len:333 (+) Transcript_56072:232-1230(+)|eukprot:CAMPEP_0170600696 /NCGR_PEP_ID=MMETSP0224-20130122/17469_1 /TAXON_ID=285029 /ORGANISM="Togula jolla, Strain CCCM 725" /LENGTH=332 /DNA_ID=CAMNT_0010925433 /DNA_START=224 /DNA_END=1222 /DNA_ORIENTATION=-
MAGLIKQSSTAFRAATGAALVPLGKGRLLERGLSVAALTDRKTPSLISVRPSPVIAAWPGGAHGRRAASGLGSKELMPEDILHLRATSMAIMQDPVCELRPEEARRYAIERPDPTLELPWWHPRKLTSQVSKPLHARKEAGFRLRDLITERLDNETLLQAFEIDNGFNMQVYFMILHAWLLHQRLVLEGNKAKRLDADLFEHCWTLVRNWMWIRKVPEYRFDTEMRNVQEFLLGCCVALDKALERPDILPARLRQELWANVYSGGCKKDSAALTLLTKYCLRQLALMLQLDTECVLNGNFVWADFPVPDGKPVQPRLLPVWREEYNKAMKDV